LVIPHLVVLTFPWAAFAVVAGAVPDYPATLDIAFPDHLSRGLALVKW
jgi:hypothetical protein